MKLDLVLENTRARFALGLLEESEMSEMDNLRNKIEFNETTQTIRTILVENGLMESTKTILESIMTEALIDNLNDQ